MSSNPMVTNYRFIFTVAAFKAGFQKISGIGAKSDIEYICEGGRTGCAYPVCKPGNSAGKITFEKGYGFFNPFQGLLGFSVGMRIFLPCTIIVMGENGILKRLFAFDSGVVSSWECAPLDAGRTEVLIDKLEIEHTGLFEISCGNFNL